MPITTGDLLPGWYCVVFCVSLDHLEGIKDKLDKITFDVTSKEKSTGLCIQVTLISTAAAAQHVSTALELSLESTDFVLTSGADCHDTVTRIILAKRPLKETRLPVFVSVYKRSSQR